MMQYYRARHEIGYRVAFIEGALGAAAGQPVVS
jgi:hypothetical protein